MIRSVWELVQKKARFFVAASVAALGLRLLLVAYFPAVVDDSRFYANIAENWLRHGIYGITNSGAITPTLSGLSPERASDTRTPFEAKAGAR